MKVPAAPSWEPSQPIFSHLLSFLSGVELEGQLVLDLGLLSLDIGLGLNKLGRESLQGLNASFNSDIITLNKDF